MLQTNKIFLKDYAKDGPPPHTPVYVPKIIIPEQTERATTNRRPRTKSSWQEEFRSAWSRFVLFVLTSFFQNNFPNDVTASKMTVTRWSQARVTAT